MSGLPKKKPMARGQRPASPTQSKILTERNTMNRLSSVRSRLRASISLAVLAAAIYAMSIPGIQGADPKPDQKAEKGAKTEKKKLTGNELYSIHCSRCHPERYPTEWNPAHWKTLMLHMRVRANLPAAQAKTILKYLQEEGGN
jgi:hypothetical protein